MSRLRIMGTNEQVMAWFMDTYSMYQGKTVNEILASPSKPAAPSAGARRPDVASPISSPARWTNSDWTSQRDCDRAGVQQCRFIAAATLAEQGVKIIGVSDHTAAYFEENGLDVRALDKHVREHRVLRGFSNEATINPDELLVQRSDVRVPAAHERVITGDNAKKLHCGILAEGANGPTTPEADLMLDRRRDEIFVIPDILCNAGGVIVSYFGTGISEILLHRGGSSRSSEPNPGTLLSSGAPAIES